jgi:hypothetical protein
MRLDNFIQLAILCDYHIAAVDVGIEDACPEGEVVGGLGDHDGVVGLRKGQCLVLGVFGELEVLIFSIVQNALHRRMATLNLKTPG